MFSVIIYFLGSTCSFALVFKSSPTPMKIYHEGNIWRLSGEWAPPIDRFSEDGSFTPGICKAKENNSDTLSSVSFRSSQQTSALWHIQSSQQTPALWHLYQHGCCGPSKASVPMQFDFLRLLSNWANKKVHLVGDSMTQQFMDAIIIGCEEHAVAMQIPNGTTFSTVPGSKMESERLRIVPYNITLNRLALDSFNYEIPASPNGFETFVPFVDEADVTYINFGLHLSNSSKDMKIRNFLYARKVLEQDLAKHPWKKHFYRLTFPQHFLGQHGEGVQYEEKQGNACAKYGPQAKDHDTSILARDVFEGSKVQILDYYDFLKNRGDLHNVDCSHFCWDRQMWKGVLFLVSSAMDA